MDGRRLARCEIFPVEILSVPSTVILDERLFQSKKDLKQLIEYT